MSECVTHTGVVYDCARLVQLAPDIAKPFKQALKQHLAVAQLGGVTRHGDQHNPDLLESLRRDWPRKGGDARLQQKLAFVLGWMSHRAADRQMKPVFRERDPDCTVSPRDCSIYHDAVVLREVFRDGTAKPFGNGSRADLLQQPCPIRTEEFERLLFATWQRMLIAMHTFIPDDDNIDVWLDNVIDRHQRLYVDLRRLAKAYCEPDPDMLRRFVEEPNFYNAADPLLVLCRQLQNGERPSVDIEDALAHAADGSLYARCVARAFGYVRAASDFFEDRMGMDELQTRLQIGRPELAG